MDEQNYKDFRKILFDYGDFDPVLIHNSSNGKPYQFKLNKRKRLEEFQKIYGSAHRLLKKPENKKDWIEYYEFSHAVF